MIGGAFSGVLENAAEREEKEGVKRKDFRGHK